MIDVTVIVDNAIISLMAAEDMLSWNESTQIVCLPFGIKLLEYVKGYKLDAIFLETNIIILFRSVAKSLTGRSSAMVYFSQQKKPYRKSSHIFWR